MEEVEVEKRERVKVLNLHHKVSILNLQKNKINNI